MIARMLTRNLFVPAIAAATALMLAGCSPAPQEHYTQAIGALEKHDYAAARASLIEAMQADPANATLIEAMARTELSLGSGEAALRYLQKLSDLGAVPKDADLLAAEAHVLAGEPQQALDRLKGMTSAEAFRIKALALVADQQFDAAREALRAGLQGSGNRGRLYADYALYVLADGDLEEARSYAAKAAKAAPAALDPLIANASVAEAERNWSAANAIYTRAAEAFPDSRAALLGKVRTLGELGRLDEAEPLIRAAYDRLSGDLEVVFLMARLEAGKGNWARVRDILQPVEPRISSHPPAQLLYADALLKQGQPELAYRMLSRLNLLYPGHPEAATKLARMKLERGDHTGAVQLLQPLIDKGVSNSDTISVFNAACKRAAGE